VIIVVAGR